MRFALVALLASQVWAQTDSERLAGLFAEYHEARVKDEPEYATSLGRNELNHLWSDYSPAARDRRIRERAEWLKKFRDFPTANLSPQERLSRELLLWYLPTLARLDRIDGYLEASHMTGFHNHVFGTFIQMPSATPKDLENMIGRLEAVPVLVDQELVLIRGAMDKGYVQPRAVLDRLIAQIGAQMRQTVDKSPLLAAFQKLPENDPLRRRAYQAYQAKFVPAWTKAYTFFTDSYAPKARAATSVGAVPGGEQVYADLALFFTTMTIQPKEVHELGLAEVKRIEGEMEKIAKEAGFRGSLTQFEESLKKDPKQQFHSKEEMLMYCRNVAKIAEPELPRLFKNFPRIPFGIRPIPEDREAATPSHYMPPAADGSRAGWFYLNAYQPETKVKYTHDALVLHEGIPGHHFQLALQTELTGLPEFRKHFISSAYAEGWGLYAESLGGDLNLYQDAYTRFGKLSSERFRAVRLVVDTGLHALGWSRDQALEYFNQHAAAQSPAEVDRYIAMPGQALAYKLGELKIMELRRRAVQQLGTKFDIREFHDVILRNGCLPLDVLDREVSAWIERNRGRDGAAAAR